VRNADLIEGFQGVAFGTVDGVITILGVVIGIATATQNSGAVVVTGLVAGLANAFGNSFGFYASELAKRAEHIQENQRLNSMTETRRSTVLAFAHSVGSTVVIVAPFFMLGLRYAMIASLTVGFVLLFGLGSVVGRFSHASPWKFAVRYVFLGLIGAALSFIAGALIGRILTLARLAL